MDISNARLFDFDCLSNFAKRINLMWMVSIWYEYWSMLTFNLCQKEQSVNNTMMSQVWVGMLNTIIHLPPIHNFVVICKDSDLECQCIRTHTKEKPFYIAYAILPF